MSNSTNRLGTVRWFQPTLKGAPPTIKNHTVTHHNGKLYCFGGYDGNVNHMSLLVYNVQEQQWTTVLSENELGDELTSDRGLNYNHRNGNGNSNIGSRSDNVSSSVSLSSNARGSASGSGARTRRSYNYNHEIDYEEEENHSCKMVGNPPLGRNGHTATVAKRKMSNNNNNNNNNSMGERVCIFIIGGWLGYGPFAAEDLHILDITDPEELIWVPVTNTSAGNSPGPCNMHSADFIPDKNQIYVFRGGNGCEYLNELHALNVDDLTWRNVQTSGEVPQQRANHSSAFLEETNQLFIFGGWNGKERLNDIHILDTNTSTWSRPYVHGSLPHPRAGMSLTPSRGKLYLFGGSGTSSKCFHDLHVLDPIEMTWLEVVEDDKEGNSDDSGKKKKFDGIEMNADESQLIMDDWRSQELNHQQRNNQTSLHRDEYMYSSPKVNAANPNEIENGPCILIQGSGPGHRAGHTATAVNRNIYIFGGSCGSDYLNDFFALDTDPPEYPRITNPTSQQLVGRRLKYFCNKEEFADVIFFVEGRRIFAHKMILALASDFYAAMFSVTNGFKETSTGCPEIDVPDCSYEAFLCIMEYIYSGNEPKLDSLCIDKVVDVLEMADQLLLDHLKQRCEQILQPAVDENNVEFLLQVAQKTNAMQLESVCYHFVRNHLQNGIPSNNSSNNNNNNIQDGE